MLFLSIYTEVLLPLLPYTFSLHKIFNMLQPKLIKNYSVTGRRKIHFANDREITQHNYNYHFLKRNKRRVVELFEDLFKTHSAFSYGELSRWEIDLEGLRQAWGNNNKRSNILLKSTTIFKTTYQPACSTSLFTTIGPKGSALECRPWLLCNELARNDTRNKSVTMCHSQLRNPSRLFSGEDEEGVGIQRKRKNAKRYRMEA